MNNNKFFVNIDNKNLFIPRECEVTAVEVAEKTCHWLNKQPRLIRYTNEYSKALTEQLKIHYGDLYNILNIDVENNVV